MHMERLVLFWRLFIFKFLLFKLWVLWGLVEYRCAINDVLDVLDSILLGDF